jgi:type I restriction enzyme S subunit
MKPGWNRRSLGELLSVQNGFAFDSKSFGSTGFPLIRIRDLKSGVTTETRYAGEFDSRYVVKAGDFLIGMDGEFACYEWKGEPALLNQRVCRLSGFQADLEPRFIYYGINAHLKSIEDVTAYATVKHLSSKQILGIEVLLPSRDEQRRIVALLDEAFEGIATAKAHAERNLRNARELFESRVRYAFSAAKDDWVQIRLGDACSIARGGSPRPIKDFLTSEPDGVNWVKISDATASAKYIFATAEKIRPAGVSRSRLVHDGDFLLSNSMSFGRPYIMRTTGCIHDGWLVLSNYQGTFSQDFLYLLLGSSYVYQQFDRLAAGSTVRNLNIDLASSVRLPVPSLDEQVAIAEELDELGRSIDQLADVCRRKLAALDELKQSLLHQAFSGQL